MKLQSSSRSSIPTREAGRFSFVSQRVYRIQGSSPDCRVVTEDHSNEPGEHYRHNDRDRRYESRPLQRVGYDDRGSNSQYDANDPPYQGKSYRFNQELPPNYAAAGPDSHPDANLSRPFGHRDKHYVHDPDSTYH